MTYLAHKKTTFNITCNVFLGTSTSLCRKNRVFFRLNKRIASVWSVQFLDIYSEPVFPLKNLFLNSHKRSGENTGVVVRWLWLTRPASDVKPRLLPLQWARRTAWWRWRSGSRPTTPQTRASNREQPRCATTRAAPSTAGARSTPAAAAQPATPLPQPGARPAGETLRWRARQVRRCD